MLIFIIIFIIAKSIIEFVAILKIVSCVKKIQYLQEQQLNLTILKGDNYANR